MEKTCYFSLACVVVLLTSQNSCIAKTFTDLATDQSSLLALKAHIISDPSLTITQNRTNSSSVSICSWIGVTCSTRHHRVVALNISNMGLSGSIPPQLGNLSFLVSLDLKLNNFSCTLPHELSRLRRLIFISLLVNNFRGEIPSWLPFLPKPEYVSVRNNSFIGSIPKSISNLGSFGSIYRGILGEGNAITVKVFRLQSEAAFMSFDVECEVLRNIRHRNLTKVISSCSNEEFKALVLEYMPKGNLEKWLYSHNYFLDFTQRLNIMIDVASALEYLHHGYSTPIVHCDLKPSNVLLDEEMLANVSDFGISKLLGEGESIILTHTQATLGYIAPEYGFEGIVSTRCDVYSYGVMLMETFTRKKTKRRYVCWRSKLEDLD